MAFAPGADHRGIAVGLRAQTHTLRGRYSQEPLKRTVDIWPRSAIPAILALLFTSGGGPFLAESGPRFLAEVRDGSFLFRGASGFLDVSASGGALFFR